MSHILIIVEEDLDGFCQCVFSQLAVFHVKILVFISADFLLVFFVFSLGTKHSEMDV